METIGASWTNHSWPKMFRRIPRKNAVSWAETALIVDPKGRGSSLRWWASGSLSQPCRCITSPRLIRSIPSAVFSPVLSPPCSRQPPFAIAGHWQGVPPIGPIPQLLNALTTPQLHRPAICRQASADRFFFAFWDFAVAGGFLTAAVSAA